MQAQLTPRSQQSDIYYYIKKEREIPRRQSGRLFAEESNVLSHTFRQIEAVRCEGGGHSRGYVFVEDGVSVATHRRLYIYLIFKNKETPLHRALCCPGINGAGYVLPTALRAMRWVGGWIGGGGVQGARRGCARCKAQGVQGARRVGCARCKAQGVQGARRVGGSMGVGRWRGWGAPCRRWWPAVSSC